MELNKVEKGCKELYREVNREKTALEVQDLFSLLTVTILSFTS